MSDPRFYLESFVETLQRLNAERCEQIASLQSRLTAAEKELRDIRDIDLARLQFPDGTVPGNTVECARGWYKWCGIMEERNKATEKERDELKREKEQITASWKQVVEIGVTQKEKIHALTKERDEAQVRVEESDSHLQSLQDKIDLLENALREAKEKVLKIECTCLGIVPTACSRCKALQTLSALNIPNK